MKYLDNTYNIYDQEAARILDEFLPEVLFDAHAHLYEKRFVPEMAKGGSCFSWHKVADFPTYLEEMKPLIGNRSLHCNIISGPDASMARPESGSMAHPESGTAAMPASESGTLHESGTLARSFAFLKEQLELYPGNVGEVMVRPGDTAEEIEQRLVHPGIRGLKCYHLLSGKTPSWEADIGEYLPESAWEAAQEHKLAITLHMVKDKALSDPANLAYIKEHAQRYPDAVLILAHAARSFAAWTAIDAVDALIPYENVWFDFAAVCEPSAIFYIMKTCGISRCMWGTDYPVAMSSGKAVSVADTFYWITADDLSRFGSKTTLHGWLVGTETLMAHRLALKMYGASRAETEAVFGGNARRLFGRR